MTLLYFFLTLTYGILFILEYRHSCRLSQAYFSLLLKHYYNKDVLGDIVNEESVLMRVLKKRGIIKEPEDWQI